MAIVGVISDTHSVLLESVENFLKNCDFIIHAGDIGDSMIIERLNRIAKVYAVYGNIDDSKVRLHNPEHQYFMIEDAGILLMHIGGYPPKYNQDSKRLIEKYNPDLFITGHSHILKVMYDKIYQHLYINPGAAGKFGFHKSITAVRFEIAGKSFQNLEVLDIQK